MLNSEKVGILESALQYNVPSKAPDEDHMINFLKAVMAGVAIFLGVQVGRDLAHKTMSATSTTPASS